jgi:hypothetical protein
MGDAATKVSAAVASKHCASVVICADPRGQRLVLMAPST